jgi:ATP-binding cassette subfamily F protein 3
LSNVESKINQLEKDIKADDLKLATNYDETAADPKFFDAYQSKKTDLEKLMEDWETLQEKIENIS